MNTIVFFLGISTFVVCLSIHIVVWRLRYPKNRPAALFFIFFVLSPIPAISYWGLVLLSLIPGTLNLGLFNWLAVFLLHFSLSAAYILTYPAVEALSPSLALVLLIGSSGRGLQYVDLAGVFADELLLTPRITDLISTKLIKEKNGRLTLTYRSRILIRFFTLLRYFIGLPEGKG